MAQINVPTSQEIGILRTLADVYDSIDGLLGVTIQALERGDRVEFRVHFLKERLKKDLKRLESVSNGLHQIGFRESR